MLLSGLERTRALGEALAEGLFGGLTVFLDGPMGAGKTTLVKVLAEHLGYGDARSPTFALVNRYETGGLTVLHADLYRLERADARQFGFDEELEDGAVLLIEWPDRLIRADFDELLILRFETDPRSVTFQARGPGALRLKERLEALS